MTLSDDLLPPADAPFVPGDGPRRRTPSRSRAHGWLRWWTASGILGAAGLLVLPAVFVVDDPTTTLFVWFGCWIAAVLCMRPAYRLGWTQRHDRYDDELCRYATGVRVEAHRLGDPAAVRLAGRTVATHVWDRRRRRPVVEYGDRTLALEERIAARDARCTVTATEVRLVDGGEVLASARGDRVGEHVDWTLDLPLGALRLRQRIAAVPSRRTLLDGWGRAWRVRADLDAAHWTADLPEGAGPVDAVFVTWFAAHLDSVGLERCYRSGDGPGGPALTALDGEVSRLGADGRFTGPDDGAWMPVGLAGTRPEVPTAEGVDL